MTGDKKKFWTGGILYGGVQCNASHGKIGNCRA